MKYLIDTCLFVWAIEGNEKKLQEFLPVLLNPSNLIYVSIATYWEIIIKKSIGKIQIEQDFKSLVEDSGFIWLDIRLSDIDEIEKLPKIHQDPFDRLLIAQSIARNMSLLSTDLNIMRYPIAT